MTTFDIHPTHAVSQRPATIGAPALDRIVELIPGVKAVGLLNVTGTQSYFDSHFPRQPILPGVLLTESILTLAGLAAGHPGLRLHSAAAMRFRRFVQPGDQVRITVEALGQVAEDGESEWRATATVDDKVAATIRALRLVRAGAGDRR